VPSTSAAGSTSSPRPSLWQRLLAFLGAPVFARAPTPAQRALIEARQRVQVFASLQGRAFVSLDDLFLSADLKDDALADLLRSHGTSVEELADDVRQALAQVDPNLDRSGASVVTLADGSTVNMNAVLESLGAAQRESDGDVNTIVLFAACLRPGPPSFVREAFLQRTGHTRWDVLWPIAHGDVDVDDDAGTRTPMAALVIYNDQFSTQEFVTATLRKHTDLVDDDAQKFMWTVHAVGVSTIVQAPLEVVRPIRDAIVQDARAQGHPLRVRVEPVVDD
jgi:ATP-dependent Clp protease adapter protein ClpS